MALRRTSTLLIALLLVSAGLVGCGDGDDDDAEATTTTTEAEGAADDDGETTEAADTTEGTETTEDPDDDEGTTTTQDDDTGTTSAEGPTDDTALADLLLDPATVGPGFAADDTLGDGSFDTDLCDDVIIDESWDDEAAQALLSGTGDDAILFEQSVLRFADDATAGDFFASVADALVACDPTVESVDVAAGDEALLASITDDDLVVAAGIVRLGDLVSWQFGFAGVGITPPVDEALLAEVAALLAG